MTVIPQLNLGGNSDDALKLYKEAISGDLQVMYFKDMPANKDIVLEGKVKDNHVVYGCLLKDGVPVLMASDDFANTKTGDNVSIVLQLTTLAEAEKAYSVLSVGATVMMPLSEVFWAERYALFVDKFGVSFIINFVGNKAVKY